MPNDNITNAPAEEETHRHLFEIIIDFWMEGFKFIKFLFYDLWIGNY